MPAENNSIYFLQNRVQELEAKIEQLRLSRRVLMNLIDKLESEKMEPLKKLEKENRRLQENNQRFAGLVVKKNRRIVELEAKLGRISKDACYFNMEEERLQLPEYMNINNQG